LEAAIAGQLLELANLTIDANNLRLGVYLSGHDATSAGNFQCGRVRLAAWKKILSADEES